MPVAPDTLAVDGGVTRDHSRRRRIAATALLALSASLTLLSSLAASASAEVALDPTFGGDGIVTAAVGPTAGDEDVGYALATQDDGKLSPALADGSATTSTCAPATTPATGPRPCTWARS